MHVLVCQAYAQATIADSSAMKGTSGTRSRKLLGVECVPDCEGAVDAPNPRRLLSTKAWWTALYAPAHDAEGSSASMDSMPSTPSWSTPTVAHGKNIGESTSEEEEEEAGDALDGQMTSMGAGMSA
jgi:hypothetical protein